MKFSWQNASIFLTCLLMGLLVAMQWRSFSLVSKTYLRDRNANIFREIQISKTANDQLRNEIENQQKRIDELSTQASSLTSLQEEMEKFGLLSGASDVEGTGVRIVIPTLTDTSWFVDLANDLTTAGAEAIAINGVRITEKTAGFRAVPPQTLLAGNRSFHAPFIIEAIGDSKVLANTLLQPGGIVPRIQKILGKKEATIEEVENLKILGVPQ